MSRIYLNRLEKDKAVLRCMVSGYTNADIASQMGCSEAAVKHRVERIMDVTGMGTRLELALMVLHNRKLLRQIMNTNR